MRKKRLQGLGGLLSAALIAGLVAGCSNDKDNGAAGSSPAASGKAVASGSSGETAAPLKELSLTYWFSHGDMEVVESPKENIPDQWLAQKTHVSVKEGYGNGGQDPIMKLSTLIAGDTLPDFAFSSNLLILDKLVQGDLVWELTPEMLQKYAPNIWKTVPELVWEGIKKDGKIYGIPGSVPFTRDYIPDLSDDMIAYYSNPPQKITWSVEDSSNALFIRDDILKQLVPGALDYEGAMAMLKQKPEAIADKFVLPIKTTEDYKKFFYDIQKLGLKENNKPVYPFGYPAADNWASLTILGSEMLGYKGYNYFSMYNTTTGKMEFGMKSPIIKEAAKIQNQMVRDKVIDPESLVQTSEKFNEKVLNGQYAIFEGGYFDYRAANKELEKAGKTYHYVPFYTQVPNRPEYPAFSVAPVKGGATMNVLLLKTIKEEDLPQVLGWFDTQYSKEWEDIRFWGPPEAGLYETLADGTRHFKDDNMQKLIVEGDRTAMDWKDAQGLADVNGPANVRPGLIGWNANSEFNPKFMLRNEVPPDLNTFLTKFPPTSEFTKNFVRYPDMNMWGADYAGLPQVSEIFDKRKLWEDAYKLSFAAKNDADFESKWATADKTLNQVSDISTLLTEQEKIFKANQELLKNK